MVQVVGVDHVIIRVTNHERSKAFYARLFAFLGFETIGGFTDMTGWRNGRTAFWITECEASAHPTRHRDDAPGLHHYALELASRSDVDAVAAFLAANDVDIVDPAGEYYEDYYAVYFLDPDGIKFECMAFGPRHLHGARIKPNDF
jgi:catechol 2,3-dioxygenase-like lactoylglutathione lyase family enzyme